MEKAKAKPGERKAMRELKSPDPVHELSSWVQLLLKPLPQTFQFRELEKLLLQMSLFDPDFSVTCDYRASTGKAGELT